MLCEDWHAKETAFDNPERSLKTQETEQVGASWRRQTQEEEEEEETYQKK